MNYQHVPIVDLPTCQMDSEALSTLNYVFCGNIVFTSFAELLTYFMAGLPEPKKVTAFLDEVGEVGWA